MCTHYGTHFERSPSNCGVQRNMPRKLVYGPSKYQCFGIHDIFATQLIQHLQCILRHGTRPTITGEGIKSTMENLILELGSGTPFWQLDPIPWSPLATPSWVAATWCHLAKTDLSLQGPMPQMKAQREHDVFIMDSFMTLELSEETLISLNDVRMFKQVTRLSDITSADGTTILETFLSSSLNPSYSFQLAPLLSTISRSNFSLESYPSNLLLTGSFNPLSTYPTARSMVTWQ